MAIVSIFEGICRLVDHLKLGETVVPILMFLVPVAFYVGLYSTGATFEEVP
jgi:hypothetical protein